MKHTNTPTQLSKAVIVLLFIMYSTIVFAQQSQLLSWAIPPNQVNFTSGTPVTSALPESDYYGAASAHLLNSMHESNGNLLFFITDEGAKSNCAIYDKNGNLIDYLKFPSNIPAFFMGDEICIVPM